MGYFQAACPWLGAVVDRALIAVVIGPEAARMLAFIGRSWTPAAGCWRRGGAFRAEHALAIPSCLVPSNGLYAVEIESQ